MISRNARVQTQLIEDLLDMSQITSGKLGLSLQQVNPKALIEQALESVMPSAQAKEIHIETALNAHTGSVKGDPSRLQQVVWNLLSNAIGQAHRASRAGNHRLQLSRPDRQGGGRGE